MSESARRPRRPRQGYQVSGLGRNQERIKNEEGEGNRANKLNSCVVSAHKSNRSIDSISTLRPGDGGGCGRQFRIRVLRLWLPFSDCSKVRNCNPARTGDPQEPE